MRTSSRSPFAITLVVALALTALLAPRSIVADTPPTSVDLFTYVRVARYDLPEPTRSVAPANSKLAQEASGVTYNWDANTLFVVGDSGTSVVQVTKDGVLIDSMTLAPGPSPQGTDFYDTEGLSYVGGGQFVLTEERDRQVNLFTYVAGGTLHKADVKTVKIGTAIGNVGIEGISYDPSTGGYILVKEKDPQSIFQTNIDFNAGTATNGSPSATSSTDLFSPPLASLSDFSDVFALSNLPSLAGQADASHLLLLSQESGQVLNISRTGVVSSRLTLVAEPGSLLSIADMTIEGLTMDRDGNLYLVNENGGGDANHPQLWVYAPSTAENHAPFGIALSNPVVSIPENTSTAAAVKLADIVVSDDGIGNNVLSVTGADAASFQVIGTALFLRAGTSLNAVTKPTYVVTVNVDDPGVGAAPDASTTYFLDIAASTGGTASLIISEVAPWSSGNSALGSDWIEITNVGTAAQSISGWKVDDDSNGFATAIVLNGVTNIAPGESVIFIELPANPAPTAATLAAKKAQFLALWFGANPPNLQVGYYAGGGIGLGTGGDQVNLFDGGGTKRAGVSFGTSTTTSPLKTFDNAAGLTNSAITALSATGVNGAFSILDVLGTVTSTAIGSPGTIGAAATPVVTIVATDATASESGADTGTFRVSRTGSAVGALTFNYTIATGLGQASAADLTVPLTGVGVIPAGLAFADIVITPADDSVFEVSETVTLTLFDTGSSDVGAASVATVTIADNDPPDTFLGSSPGAATSSITADFTFSGSDPQAAIARLECSLDGAAFTTCASPAQYTDLAEGTHTFSVRAVGTSGGADPTPASFTWIVDLTPPLVQASRTPANAAGWNNTPVVVTFLCTDVLSGLAAGSPPPRVTLAADGAGQSVSRSCTDLAGNSASASVQNINIDLTAPAVTAPAGITTPQITLTGALVSYAAPAVVETGSGLVSTVCAPASGTDFPVGHTTVTCTATDLAGNAGAASFDVHVTKAPNGRMTGVGHVDDGKKHEHFTFRVSQLLNHDYGRLEFWTSDPRQCRRDDDWEFDRHHDGDRDGDYGRDHGKTSGHFTATRMNVVFSNDPDFDPGRGKRPATDTVRIYGTGVWNGRSGYTFEAVATDQGEPGRHRDTFSIVIRDARGVVVASTDGDLDGGNIQSTRLARW